LSIISTMSQVIKKEYLLVTGGYGFIGSHYVELVYHKYSHLYHIVNMDMITYAANMDNIDPLIQ